MLFETALEGKALAVSFNDDLSRVTIEDRTREMSWSVQKNGRRLLRIGDRVYRIDDAEIAGRFVTFTMNGSLYRIEVKNERDLLLERLGFRSGDRPAEGIVSAPMPGKILEVRVRKDDPVEAGQTVAILEAMKMENELKAPASGIIAAIHADAGDAVEKNQPILEIEQRG